MFHALIKSETQDFFTARDKFNSLVESLENVYGIAPFFSHISYLQIIGMGMQAVPLLLEKVRAGSNDWFVALSAITGKCPDNLEPSAQREFWLNSEWAKYSRISC